MLRLASNIHRVRAAFRRNASFFPFIGMKFILKFTRFKHVNAFMQVVMSTQRWSQQHSMNFSVQTEYKTTARKHKTPRFIHD